VDASSQFRFSAILPFLPNGLGGIDAAESAVWAWNPGAVNLPVVNRLTESGYMRDGSELFVLVGEASTRSVLDRCHKR
jgi:hypothetical protein